ncbi:MAG: valine--tRNA ligase [Bryobacteraceae bacterium]|jgi:valyl-tRNA synthetase
MQQPDKVYEPRRFEPAWAQWWIDQNLFRADAHRPGPVFSMVIPPPNVTGSLHMGHMLDHTIMDAAVRWHRMRGDNTLWLPGTDHAGIATQMVVERELAKDGITRHQLGRQAFEQRVWEWKRQYGGRITEQMKAIGDSVDWSRERFTLSPELSHAVTEAFVLLYERGLIYRGTYMVNWCPRCHTALSDLETVHEDTEGSLWHIRYPVNETDRFLTVATTRPETMLGDTAVAINARDPRYTGVHGHTVTLPLMNREIPIILDDLADPEFGSGVVKVTPAHDPNDLEAGKRHSLPHVKVIDENGHMTAEAGPYAGLDRFEARKRIVADLEKLGLLEKVAPHALAISKCDRCKTIVEPLVSTQWFVRTKPLAEKVIAAVEDGRIRFVPENWNATFFNWMRNIRDWCISRQLWWGHRIPAWHCGVCHEIAVARTAPAACPQCGSHELTQDTDVLDTWFSSGLWPFATLGWPRRTADLKTYYPTSVLITAYDIIFFWVARMMMMGLELTGEVPFREVHMHGLVRDKDKKKMSKTSGNTIDPLDSNEKYGTDAVRMSLLMGTGAGTDIVYTEDRLTTARNFANKLWNAARLISLTVADSQTTPLQQPEAATAEDRWFFTRINQTATAVAALFEQHRYNEVAQELWHLFWDDFCDWYIEVKKLRVEDNRDSLLYSFSCILRFLHPLVPFITEELWHRLDTSAGSIALAPYPAPGGPAGNTRDMDMIQAVVIDARTYRADQKLDKKLHLNGTFDCPSESIEVVRRELPIIEKLANLSLQLREGGILKLALQLPEADKSATRARLEKDMVQLEKLIAGIDAQFADEKSLSRKPEHIVNSLREKHAGYEAQLTKAKASLDAL